jgi:alpha-tubulin suppressor-like RCC1 family protein
MTFGKKHLLVLMNNSEVFACGDNSRGQLGFGTKEKKYPTPERIRTLVGKPVKQVRHDQKYVYRKLFTFSTVVFSETTILKSRFGVSFYFPDCVWRFPFSRTDIQW